MSNKAVESWQLKQRQSLSLEAKVHLSKIKIRQWQHHWHGKTYVAFSGGKDSTVLLHLVRSMYPDTPAMFADTGLEYPEVRDFVKTIPNVMWVKPKMSFTKVLTKYGYPVISKTVANVVGGAKPETNNTRWQRLCGTFTNPSTGEPSRYNCTKWKFLYDAPFKISDRCCYVMKKEPAHRYDKETGRVPYTGMMAQESLARRFFYMKTGCNAFDKAQPQSQPIAFWTEQDILQYLANNNLAYAGVYGSIVEEEVDLVTTKLCLTGEQRTGCMFCMFGVHLEKEPNRFQRMKKIHPKLYKYCMDQLGCKKVLEYIDVPYE